MANPTCTTSSLIPTCSNLTNISERQLMCEIIYTMMLELAAIGGTTYSVDTLNQTSGTALIGMSRPQLESAELAIAANNATAAGANIPAFQDRQTQIACMVNLDDLTLLKMKTFLWCQLGVHKTYPQ